MKRSKQYLIRRYLLSTVDVIMILLALFLYLSFFYKVSVSPIQVLIRQPIWLFLLVGIWLFYAYIFNLYRLGTASSVSEILIQTAKAAILTGLTYLFIPFLSPVFPESRMPAFVFLIILVLLMLLWRFIFAFIFQNPVLLRRALIVGAGWSGREIAKVILEDREIRQKTAYHLFGFVDDNEEKVGLKLDGLKVISTAEHLFKLARRLKVNDIIIAIPEAKSINARLYNNLIDCENYGMNLVSMGDLYESLTGKVPVKKKDNEYYMAYPYISKKNDNFYIFMNRLINIFCGIIGAIVLFVLLPLIFMGNMIFSRGPLLYKQERVGKGGVLFVIYKFRTMITDAEKQSGPVMTGLKDERVTAIGKFLRKSRMDELPQFWNILKGEMNLIGPRPERPVFVAQLTESIPFFNTRHLVKPGITGWAQVNYKYGANPGDSLIKLQYDLFYIKNRSLLLDLKIVLRTIDIVFKFKGN